MSRWFAISLWTRVLGGLALGLVLARAWPAGAHYVAFLGDLFVRAIRMPVTPYHQLVGIIPLNIVDALAKCDMLALIFVAILLGVGTVLAVAMTAARWEGELNETMYRAAGDWG